MHQPCSLLRSLVTSALIVGMMLAPLPRVSGAASVWRPDDPPTEEIPKAEVTEASDVPLPPENTYTASQQPIMTEAFCLPTFAGLAVFQTDQSALSYGSTGGTNTTVGAVTWRTLHVSMYDWQGAGSSFSGAEFFTSHNVDMALLVGELKGPCATVPCIALAFDLDDNDVRKHYLIPLVRATENLHYVALTATHGGTRAWATNPCDSDTFCEDTYRDRLKQVLATVTPSATTHTVTVSSRPLMSSAAA